MTTLPWKQALDIAAEVLGAVGQGPLAITEAKLTKLCPHMRESMLGPLVDAMTERFPPFEIDTPLRICHFLAQAAEETDGLRALVEAGSGAAYEGRIDLGNTQPGDGRRYKGRGIFRLVGRAEYRAFGRIVQAPLEDVPDLAASPHLAVHIACSIWQRKGQNHLADRDELRKITRRIDPESRGLSDRAQYLDVAKSIWAPGPR